MTEPPDLTDLLVAHRAGLVRWMQRHAGGLARFESMEDLAQGVHVHALGVADRFAWQGEAAFVAWLHAVARRYVADRNAYWRALKRDAGPVLRLSLAAPDGDGPLGALPPTRRTGPLTFADRRDLIEGLTCALDTLPPRDRDLVRTLGDDQPLEDVAEQLGLSYAAAQRARLRARERLRRAFDVLMRARRGAAP